MVSFYQDKGVVSIKILKVRQFTLDTMMMLDRQAAESVSLTHAYGGKLTTTLRLWRHRWLTSRHFLSIFDDVLLPRMRGADIVKTPGCAKAVALPIRISFSS